jgi:REP element-mobilizing transposase RayT
MTPVRRVLRGTTQLITRRCSERRFFLKPSRKTAGIFLYAVALYAKRYAVQIHAYCVLSNHFHLVLTDTVGRLPDFQRDVDALIAKATNCALGRWDAFWERVSYSAVELVTPESVLEKIVYTLANPVAAGLVREASRWPGDWSDPRRIGGPPLTIERPKVYFDEKGQMPASVELQLTPPPDFADDPTFVERVLEALREAEAAEAAKLASQERTFMGVARILAQSFFARPAPGEPRRVLSPRVACRNKWKRIEALQRLKWFEQAYREALDAWRTGQRDVLFPPGTWQMRVLHAARCADYG